MTNLLRAIFLITVVSCQTTTSSDTTSSKEEKDFEIVDTDPSMFAVSLSEAEKNIKFYDKVSKEALGVDPIRAFTIRSIDVIEAIGMPMKNLKDAKYRHLRVYMGLDSATQEFKVYLTPVEGARLSQGKPGKDVILDGPYKGNGELADGDGPYVMDFSQPCPNACDDGSPLNQ